MAQTLEWKEKYPINMNKYEGLTPEKVIKYINDNFERPIVSTDVGQNQLWTTQFFDIETHRQLLTSADLEQWVTDFRLQSVQR